MVNNTYEALELCEASLNKILDLPLTSGLKQDIFTQETIGNIREIAEASIYYRKKKDIGVIGGSVAGIIGGGLSIAGAALIPFTFGASIGLIVSGGVIGLAGAGTSIGFSVEKVIGDKDRVKELKPNLEVFIDFNKKFAQATVTIHELFLFIDTKKKPNLCSRELLPHEVTHIRKIEEETRLLYEGGENELEIYKKFKLIDKCVQNIHKEIGDFMKHWLTIEEIIEFPKCFEKESFEQLVNAVPAPPNKKGKVTFRAFVIRYLKADTNANIDSDIAGPIGEAGGAVAKLAVGGTGIGTRVAAGTFGAVDDIARVGATVARIAKGVSAASIILSALGIVVDVAFLGHAIYDLVKVKENDDKRKAAKKGESDDFAEILLDLVDLMNSINQICNVA